MLNQVVMVGRLVATPEVKETENGKKFDAWLKSLGWTI